LTESAEDVLNVLSDLLRRPLREGKRAGYRGQPASRPGEDEAVRARADILELLGPSAVSVDEILQAGSWSVPVVQFILLELELAGRIERHPGAKVSLKPAWDQH
jgi:DNA processing protein